MDKEQYKEERIKIEILRIRHSWDGECPSEEKLREMAEWSIKFENEQLTKRRRTWRMQLEKANDFFGFPRNKSDLEQLKINIAKKAVKLREELDSDESWWTGTVEINRAGELFYYPVVLGIPILFLGCYSDKRQANYAVESVIDIDDFALITEAMIDELLDKTNAMYARWISKQKS